MVTAYIVFHCGALDGGVGPRATRVLAHVYGGLGLDSPAMHSVDLLVVGAGPAGISLAVEAREAGLAAEAVQVLEKSGEHSWSIRVLYPDAKLVTANYKGIDARCEGVLCLGDSSKDETLSYLDRKIAEYAVPVQYETEVFGIDV